MEGVLNINPFISLFKGGDENMRVGEKKENESIISLQITHYHVSIYYISLRFIVRYLDYKNL